MSLPPEDRALVTERAEDRLRGDRVVILASARLSDFPLPSGKRLGLAHRNEIEEAVTVFRVRAGTAAFRAHWLEQIAQRLPADTPVADILSDSDLEAIARAILPVNSVDTGSGGTPLLPAAE